MSYIKDNISNNEILDNYWQDIPAFRPKTSTHIRLNNFATCHIIATNGWQLLVYPPYIVSAIAPDMTQLNYTAKHKKDFNNQVYKDVNYFFRKFGTPYEKIYTYKPI